MTNIPNLYENFKALIRQWTYVKTEIDTNLSNKSNIGHNHDCDDIVDDSAYINLEISADSTQSEINSAIDSKMGNVISILLGTGE